MKRLWVVGAGAEAVPGIRRAKAMGLHVVASDRDPLAPGFNVADEAFLLDTYDGPATAGHAQVYQREHGLHGVIAMCADVPYTVAHVAAACGLHGLPPAIARLGTDKLDMKQFLRLAGVPTARGWAVSSSKEIVRLLLQVCGDTVVVKPADSRGARGVTRVSSPNDAEAAYRIAACYSPAGRVLVEEWLPGPQVSTEGVLLPDGQFSVPGFLDRNYDRLDEFAPYVIEDGATGPSRLTPAQQDDVKQVFETAARAVVGDVPCTVKGDMVLTPDGPMVIELALRLSGGYMSTELVPRMTGVDLVGVAIRLALREPVPLRDVTPGWPHGVAIRFNIPPGCTCHPERSGWAIGEGVTREDAVAEAQAQLRLGNVNGT